LDSWIDSDPILCSIIETSSIVSDLKFFWGLSAAYNIVQKLSNENLQKTGHTKGKWGRIAMEKTVGL
jgi:hypothetical protein